MSMVEHINKRILILPPVVILIAGGLFLYFGGASPRYETAAVVRGPIEQSVLSRGNVQSPTTIRLHFKGSGTLTTLAADTGQEVAAGQVLARQDSGVLLAQRAQAEASVEAAQAALSKVQQGATQATIDVSKAALTVAQQSLLNYYASVVSTLGDAYAKANDAVVTQIALFFNNPRTINPELTFQLSDSSLSIAIENQRVLAGVELAKFQSEYNTIASVSDEGALDDALVQALDHLTVVRALLASAVSAVEQNVALSSATAATYRTSAYAGLSEVNTAITAVKTLQQSIAAGKASVVQAQAKLSETVAPSTQTDIDAARAAVAQARANVQAIDAQLRDLTIVAPVSGTVSDTNGSVGEVVGPDTTIVSLLPAAKLEVKVNVSEDNVVAVHAGEHARIELDAFPSGTLFSGTVSEIDPAETIIGGAIYYQTTVAFDQNYENVRPGMTANVWIDTGAASNTLTVPASALQHDQAGTYVQVVQGGRASRRDVKTGLIGDSGMIEIISGLSEGEQVVTGTK